MDFSKCFVSIKEAIVEKTLKSHLMPKFQDFWIFQFQHSFVHTSNFQQPDTDVISLADCRNVIYGCELTLIVAYETGSVAKVLVTLDNLLLSIIVTF